jgi:hypothetical protein
MLLNFLRFCHPTYYPSPFFLIGLGKKLFGSREPWQACLWTPDTPIVMALLWHCYYLAGNQARTLSSNTPICPNGQSLSLLVSHLAASSSVIIPNWRSTLKVPVSSCLWPSHLFLNLHVIILIKTGLTTKRIRKSQVGFEGKSPG